MEKSAEIVMIGLFYLVVFIGLYYLVREVDREKGRMIDEYSPFTRKGRKR